MNRNLAIHPWSCSIGALGAVGPWPSRVNGAFEELARNLGVYRVMMGHFGLTKVAWENLDQVAKAAEIAVK